MKNPVWLLLCALSLAACSKPKDDAGSTVTSAAPASVPTIEAVPVVSKPLDTLAHLEGELKPYEEVAIYARANGFVQSVRVDRGTQVKSGQLLLTIVAPELNAQRAEAQAKLQVDKSTAARLSAASQTPGAVAAHEVELAEAAVTADQARVDALRAIEQYLNVTAPFDGVVTERNVHPGALVGPQAGSSGPPLLRVEQVAKLRLTIPVPESLVGAIAQGTPATFSVRAFPGVNFTGITSRISRSVDEKTRSMAVELDVSNTDGRLAPGMFADVKWPVKRAAPSLFVPPAAIVSSTEKTFVERIKDGVVEQVPVTRGVTQGDLIEVIGPLKEGDLVARRGNEELRNGTHVNVAPPKTEDGGAK
jgi:membrane fusion protein, multidrug efflux system